MTFSFDFLFYQFQFSTKSIPRTQFFFLPESVLPDSFYDGKDREADFEKKEFQKFRIDLDTEGRWINRILEIIHDYPSPRQTASRPIRREHHEPKPQSGLLKHPDLDITLWTQPTDENLPELVEAGVTKDYTRLMIRKHRNFYLRIMDECCRRCVKILRF